MEAAFEQVELWIVKFGKLAIECSSNLGFLGLVESEDYNILGCNSKQFQDYINIFFIIQDVKWSNK